MGDVFIGSEAIAAGRLTEYQLRRWYRTIFRDVYIAKRDGLSLDDRILGAWLWSRRRAVIAGIAASALHGARWVDADTTIDLVSRSARLQNGLIVRNETLDADEVTTIKRLLVTSVARTAFDLSRHLPRDKALARLDALMRATPFSTEDVSVLAAPRVTWLIAACEGAAIGGRWRGVAEGKLVAVASHRRRTAEAEDADTRQ